MTQLSDYEFFVETTTEKYPIHVGNGLLSTLAPSLIAQLSNGSRAVVVSHPGLTGKYAQPLCDALKAAGIDCLLSTIPAGERTKSLKTVSRLYDDWAAQHLDRRTVIVAVGGGVLGDLAGFAAATYLRGVRVVQVPTTLLAQVDASIGGKTGVDLPAGKNLVGAFHQPRAVIVDPETLRTLPLRELRSGLAEVIKYGIIFDNRLFAEVKNSLPAILRRNSQYLLPAIARCCEIKAQIVSQDETEQGIRAILNFGHTIGHAVETATRYRTYKHGEAVAIGMVSACLIGEALDITPSTVTSETIEAIQRAGLPIHLPADITDEQLLQHAAHDKKARNGKLRWVLSPAIGTTCVQGDVDNTLVLKSLRRQRELPDVVG